MQAAQAQATQVAIAYRLAATSQNATRQVGDAMVSMLQQTAQLGKELGKGENFDSVG